MTGDDGRGAAGGPAGDQDGPDGGSPRPASEGDEAPRRVYRRRRDRFERRRERAAGRARRVGAGRVLAFTSALGLGLAAEWTAGGWTPALWAAAAAAAAAFLALVVHHRRLRREQQWNGTLADLNREALARLDRAWKRLPGAGPAAGPAPDDHPYAPELDLFGDASVRTLLGPAATAPGAARLRGWLLEAARPERGPEPGRTERRQRWVDALADRLELREALAAHGRLSEPVDPGAVDRFLQWAEGGAWLRPRPRIRWAAWGLPLATWTLAAAHLAGVLARPWWGLPVLLTLYLAGRTSSEIHAAFERAGAGEAAFGRWAAALERIASLKGDPRLSGLAAPLAGGDRDAPARLRRLERLVHLADARHGLMHFFLQVLFCWDLHVLRALERWKRRSGDRVRGWIDALARVDALSALASLRHAHPDWAFADLRPGAAALRADDLGHPLLPPGACVRNDVEVGPPGRFLLVTGSNMSGKSTLLKAAGLAVVLGRAGAPACARDLRLPPLAVHTGLGARDSVVEGVSQYMAELERVRSVVEAARELEPGGGDGFRAGRGAGSAAGDGAAGEEGVPGPRLLYLLDEPLQGTNEAERREAVRIIVRELLARGAVGAVATHDLRLHETDGLREAARPVHFTGEVGSGGEEEALSFDYRLREGPATSTNALDLLRLAGLAPDADTGGEHGGG